MTVGRDLFTKADAWCEIVNCEMYEKYEITITKSKSKADCSKTTKELLEKDMSMLQHVEWLKYFLRI